MDGILELKIARLSVVSDGHHIHLSVVELNPGQLVAVRGEVHGLGVRQHLLLVHPVGHTVEDHPGPAAGADHDVLALRCVTVVDVGTEHVGNTGSCGTPHGQLERQLRWSSARRGRRGTSGTSSSQSLD